MEELLMHSGVLNHGVYFTADEYEMEDFVEEIRGKGYYCLVEEKREGTETIFAVEYGTLQ